MKLTDSDKIIHAKGGAVVAVFALAFAVLANLLPLHPVTVAVACGAVAVGLAIEGQQWLENGSGTDAKREDSGWDAFATAQPGLLLAAAVEMGVRYWQAVNALAGN